MKLSEIERIAKAAMNACLAVINHPRDSFAREVFDSLAEVIDPAFLKLTNHEGLSQPPTSAGKRVGSYRPEAD
jgi:hypothetical protein